MTVPYGPLQSMDAAQGEPQYLGTIDYGAASKNNTTASSAFGTTGLDGKVMLAYNAGTVAVRINTGATASVAASNTRGANFGPLVQAGATVTLRLHQARPFIAAIASDGSTTGNLDFWEMT